MTDEKKEDKAGVAVVPVVSERHAALISDFVLLSAAIYDAPDDMVEEIFEDACEEATEIERRCREQYADMSGPKCVAIILHLVQHSAHNLRQQMNERSELEHMHPDEFHKA